jgi:hypothetical protein
MPRERHPRGRCSRLRRFVSRRVIVATVVGFLIDGDGWSIRMDEYVGTPAQTGKAAPRTCFIERRRRATHRADFACGCRQPRQCAHSPNDHTQIELSAHNTPNWRTPQVATACPGCASSVHVGLRRAAFPSRATPVRSPLPPTSTMRSQALLKTICERSKLSVSAHNTSNWRTPQVVQGAPVASMSVCKVRWRVRTAQGGRHRARDYRTRDQE